MADQKGFTLIEMVMSLVLLGIIAVTAGMLIYQGTRSYETLSDQSEAARQASLALERVSRELRSMRCTPSGNSCTPTSTDVPVMTASEVRFLNGSLEGRGLRLDADTLRLRTGTGNTDPEYALATGITALTFEYLKPDGSTASLPDEIWTINVNMSFTHGQAVLPVKASVHPRGFR